jgi:hypothetical protein
LLFKGDALDPVTADGYFSQPRPSARDVRIAAILRQWSQLPELDRRRAELDLDESRLEVLEVFAERMACTAVATRDPEALRNAVTALALRKNNGDWRVAVTILALCYDAAGRISFLRRNFSLRYPDCILQKEQMCCASFARARRKTAV